MPRVRLPVTDFGASDLSDLTRSYMEGMGACETSCGCSSCQPSVKTLMESVEDKASRKKRMEKIHQDIAHELVGISKKIERAFPERKGEMMGFGADATGAALSSGMSFLETPSWEGAGKLAEAGAQAAEASNTSCKPDPVVTAMIGGALALLTGGIGGALATVLGAAGAMLPSIMGAAFGCPEGKRKMGEAIKKCLEAMDPKILWVPLKILSDEDYDALQNAHTSGASGYSSASYGYSAAGFPAALDTRMSGIERASSAVAKARINSFTDNVVGYISGGSSPEQAVKGALFKAAEASSDSSYRQSPANVQQELDDQLAYSKQWGTDPAKITSDLNYNTSWMTDEVLAQRYPGYKAVVLVVKACVENAVVKAAAEKAGTRIPQAALGPTAQVQIYNPAPATGGMNLLPLVIGGGVLAVALAAKNRGGE